MAVVNSEFGAQAARVERSWCAHANNNCSAANTIFAVFGVASKAGRIVDHSWFLNTPYMMWLDDVCYDSGVSIPNRSGEWAEIRSEAAMAMIRDGLRRSNGRRVPMTTAAHLALLKYFDEEETLISDIEGVLEASRCGDVGRYKQFTARHRKAIRILRQEVEKTRAA